MNIKETDQETEEAGHQEDVHRPQAGHRGQTIATMTEVINPVVVIAVIEECRLVHRLVGVGMVMMSNNPYHSHLVITTAKRATTTRDVMITIMEIVEEIAMADIMETNNGMATGEVLVEADTQTEGEEGPGVLEIIDAKGYVFCVVPLNILLESAPTVKTTPKETVVVGKDRIFGKAV